MIPKNKAKRLDLDSRDHDVIRDWIIRRVDWAQDGKKELERDALAAFKHYCCWIDELKWPWPSKTYKPLFFSTAQSKLSKTMEAMFASPPILDYLPENGTDSQQALAYTRTIDWHLRQTRPRKAIYNGTLGQMFAGSQMWYSFWNYQEKLVQYWKRVPLADAQSDPNTGLYAEDGSWAWVLGKKIVKDHPDLKAVPFQDVILDDRVDDIQRGEFAGLESRITAEEARDRVKCDGWDPRAVERALKGDLGDGESGMKARLDWMQEIGLKTQSYRDGIDVDSDTGERSMVHVIELYRYRKGRVERLVLLNRNWVAYQGWSPFGHGRYPFILSRAYSLPGKLYGLSDYHVLRYLNRGVQTLINAQVSEASTHAMPPLMIPENGEILGHRYEPRALWRLRGMLPEQVVHLPFNGTALQHAGVVQSMLEQSGDMALGTSDVGKGSAGAAAAAQKATAIQLAFEASGLREKLNIDNLADEFMMAWSQDTADLTHQFQDYSVEIRINPTSPPVTMYPEDLRAIQVYPANTVSTTALRELRQKRVQDLYNQAVANKEPWMNRQELAKMVVEAHLPNEVDRIMLDPEQVQAEMGAATGMPMRQGPAAMGRPNTTMSPYGNQDVAQLAGELGATMAA